MRTDGKFEAKHITIPVKNGEPLRFCPIGDIHRDNELHADHEFQQWLKDQHNPGVRKFYIGMGDSCDFMRAHTRAMIRHVEIEAEDVQDALQRGGKLWVENLAEELHPIAKRFVGVMGGNHYMEFVIDTPNGKLRQHSEQYLAEILGCDYLGVMCALTITLEDAKKAKRATVRLICHHGAGGGQTPGASVNRVARMLQGWNAQVALMGDDHKRFIQPIGEQLSAEQVDGRDVITATTHWVGRTGSFLRGFEPGKSSYVVDRAFNPLSIGTVEVELKLKTCPRTGRAFIAIGGHQPA